MDSDFAEKLKSVLSDPEAMSKITAIASGLGASSAAFSGNADKAIQPTDEAEDTLRETQTVLPSAQENAVASVMQNLNTQSDPRLLLLTSLKPLLREEKRERIDAMTRALALASMMKSFRK